MSQIMNNSTAEPLIPWNFWGNPGKTAAFVIIAVYLSFLLAAVFFQRCLRAACGCACGKASSD